MKLFACEKCWDKDCTCGEELPDKPKIPKKERRAFRLARLQKIEDWLKHQPKTHNFAVSKKEPLVFQRDPAVLKCLEAMAAAGNKDYEFFRVINFVKEIVILRARLKRS